ASFNLQPWAPVDSQSNLEQITKVTTRTTTLTNIENLFKNSFEFNFTTKNMQDCTSTLNIKQGIELEDLKHKNIILDTINLTQSSTNLKKCVNDSDIGNDVTSTIKKFAESENIIKVKNDTSTSNTSDTNQNTK